LSILEALILGIIQGLTEFLPISSSGHLAVTQHLLGLSAPDANLFFNVMLHFATVLAILAVYWKDFLFLFTERRREAGLILLGTIPAGVIGLLFKDTFESLNGVLWAIGIGFLTTATILTICDRAGDEDADRRHLGELAFGAILMIGLAQAVALMPGVSRSGMTIAAALLLGTQRDEAVRFSFLLAVPVILGASILELKDFAQTDHPFEPIPLLIGMAAAGLVGYGALRVLLSMVKRRKLVFFALYCWLLGGCTLVWGMMQS
jgi:undecaprenyl-diphosphatase